MRTFREKYGEWALITGASSGIGSEYSKQLAAKELNVVMVARRSERLEALAEEIKRKYGVDTKIIVADLSTDAGIQVVKDETQQLNIGLLVNNAGREDSGHFLRTSIEEALNTVDLNCRAPLQLTHHFAQIMAKREKGGIIFMSSVVSFQGVPHIANYAASKAYDLILAEGVAAELKPYNVDVTAVAPGFAKTELSPAFNFDGLPMKPMAPELVARKGISSLGRKRLTIPGAINKFLYLSGKYLQPRRINTFAFGMVFKRVLRNKL